MTPPEKTVYNDNLLARLCITFFVWKLSQAAGKPSEYQGYAGLVDLSKTIVRGRSAKQQQAIVAEMFKSLIPGFLLAAIRKLFPANQLFCELNALFATKLFSWLVGPCNVIEVEVPGEEGQLRKQKSGVHIEKCRYLEQSRCVGMCINMCKLPTQAFFTHEFGFPLTLTPNFEELSCEMVFGKVPPPLQEEPAYQQPCFSTEGSTSIPEVSACPKVRES